MGAIGVENYKDGIELEVVCAQAGRYSVGTYTRATD
jgi:hypothetical protein